MMSVAVRGSGDGLGICPPLTYKRVNYLIAELLARVDGLVALGTVSRVLW